MPYATISELPDPVKSHLPKHAQDIYKESFNNAWDKYRKSEDRRGGATREETAHKIAWNAVKREYSKDEATGKWHRKD